MKKSLFLVVGVAFLIGWNGAGVAQQVKVSPELWQKVQAEEFIAVLVQLNVPWQPEGKLSKEEAAAQRKAITTAQEELMTELTGTKHKVRRQFQGIPGIALEVGPDALAVLEHSARVVNVTEDKVGGGAAHQSKVPPDVWQKAQQKGVVRIIVQLNVPTKEIGKLSKGELLAQQKTIASAQDELMAELAGTQHKLGRKFKNTPGVSLEVGPDALAVLNRSPRVVAVSELGLDKPHGQKSMSKQAR